MKNKTVVPSCDICQLRANGRCSELANVVCSDFLVVPLITNEEKSSWPDLGGATALRFNKGSVYLDKKRRIY